MHNYFTGQLNMALCIQMEKEKLTWTKRE